jgi:hypothetical protein
MALASEKVTASMVEATEFPHLSNKFRVMGVPRTVIDDEGEFFIEGAAPEPMVVGKLKQALGK